MRAKRLRVREPFDMKLLYVSDVYLPRINGVSTSIKTFRESLQAMGHEVHLVAPAYDLGEAPEPWIHRLPSRVVVVDPEDRMMKAGSIKALHRRLRAEHFDLVHIQTPFVAHHIGVRLARRVLQVPAVATFHTHFEEYLSHYLPWAPRRLLRFAVRHFTRRQAADVDALVVPSTAISELMQGYGVRNTTRIIPTGINLERFRGGDGARFRALHSIAPDVPLLLFVGRLAHEKNIHFLIRVLRRVRNTIPQARLVIAGEGPATGSLRRLVKALQLEEAVHIIGNIHDHERLLDCYRAADLFVFASRTETQGLVLLEAMALGVPVVAAAILGTRDILQPQRGALVTEVEEEAFSAAVIKGLSDSTLREHLSREAVEYVREWSTQATAQRMAALYAELLEQPCSVPATAEA